MGFYEKWQTQFNSFMEYVLIALVGGVLVACFATTIKIRYLVGSVIFGAVCGAVGAAVFTSEWASIGLTILGVLTAPVTIAKISGMSLWEAVEEIQAVRKHLKEEKDNKRKPHNYNNDE